MAWVRLDDQMPEHPKFDALSDSAFRLHIHGLCYCARQLTDGLIPKVRAHRLIDSDEVEELIWELVGAGIWEPNEGGYTIHDYLAYNPSRESIQAKRAATAQRQKNFRERHVTDDDTEPVSNASHNGHSNAVTNAVSNTSPVPSRPVPLPKEEDGVLGEADGADAPVIIPLSNDVDPRVYEVLGIMEQPRTKNNVKYASIKIVKYPNAEPITKAIEAHDHVMAHPRKYSFPLRVWGNWMKPAKWEQDQKPNVDTKIKPIFPKNNAIIPDLRRAFEIVAQQVSADEYNRYMGQVTTSQPDGMTVMVSYPDPHKRARFQTRFLPLLTSALHEIHSPYRLEMAAS